MTVKILCYPITNSSLNILWERQGGPHHPWQRHHQRFAAAKWQKQAWPQVLRVHLCSPTHLWPPAAAPHCIPLFESSSSSLTCPKSTFKRETALQFWRQLCAPQNLLFSRPNMLLTTHFSKMYNIKPFGYMVLQWTCLLSQQSPSAELWERHSPVALLPSWTSTQDFTSIPKITLTSLQVKWTSEVIHSFSAHFSSI